MIARANAHLLREVRYANLHSLRTLADVHSVYRKFKLPCLASMIWLTGQIQGVTKALW